MLFFTQWNLQKKKTLTYTTLSGICYAITDEFHQYFVDGRSCEIRDVCIDAAGIITGIIIMILIERLMRKKYDV